MRSAVTWPVLLACAALLVSVVQLVMGVPLVGNHAAHDGVFAVSSLVQFQSELRGGHFPRWTVVGNGGLGSIVFFFYPPGAYFLASLLGLGLPSLTAATVIGLAQVPFRLGALLACFAWLRRHTTTEAALTGSALFLLMPYVAILNPQARLAFAECAATALVPFAFLAVDVGRGRMMTTIVLVAAALCALTFVNLPTAALTSSLIVVYAALLANNWPDALRYAATTASGVILGMGLAACSLIPALALLPASAGSTSLWGTQFQPEHNFLLTANVIRAEHGPLQGLLMDIGLLVPVAVALAYGRQALRLDRRSWALLGTFALAVFLTLPLSAPIWTLVRPLRSVQFPWRLLLPISLLAAALVATALPACPVFLRRCAIFGGFILAGAAIACSVVFGDHMSTGSARTQQALSSRAVNFVYFLPADAANRGWLSYGKQGGDFRVRAESLVSGCVERPAAVTASAGDHGGGPGMLRFGVAGCAGPTALPQFYFPGWTAQAGSTTLSVTSDPASGLVSVDIPPGTSSVTLRRETLGIEWLGLAVSAICLCLWGGIAFAATRSRREQSDLATASVRSISNASDQ
jgi:hypothetical protein